VRLITPPVEEKRAQTHLAGLTFLAGGIARSKATPLGS
jgi:hypothetical protein